MGTSEDQIDNSMSMRRSSGWMQRFVEAFQEILMSKIFWRSALAAFGITYLFAVTPALSQALKTAKVCNEEYKAQKPAIQAAKQLKRDFISTCRASPVGSPTPIGSSQASPSQVAPAGPASRTSTVGTLKTAGACNDEYKANKEGLKNAKETKKEFISACRALPPGTPTPIGTAQAKVPQPAPAPTIPPATAPTTSASPAPMPAPAPRSQNATPKSSSPGESACGNGYAHLPASHTAAQFCDETSAKARCPSQPVVWVNTKSKIYHKTGSNTYGHTKEGAYMCESDATAEGDRASKNGH